MIILKRFTKLVEVAAVKGEGHLSYDMLTKTNGCVAGCCAGISVYSETEYSCPGMHADQEGFLVLEGSGKAKVGDDEFSIEPEVAFIVPAGTLHSIKKGFDSKPVKVFWFHSAIG